MKVISIILKTSFAAQCHDSKPNLLLATNVDDMSGLSNVMRQTKGSATKTPVSYPNIIKLYNNGMGGVDIMNHKTAAYRLDCKSKYRFYLTMFFDLIDVALVKSHLVYAKLGNRHIITEFQNYCDKSFYW